MDISVLIASRWRESSLGRGASMELAAMREKLAFGPLQH